MPVDDPSIGPRRSGGDECSCHVKPPRYEHAYGNTMGRYSVYMTAADDDTRFDPACPFHGNEGSMVVTLHA